MNVAIRLLLLLLLLLPVLEIVVFVLAALWLGFIWALLAIFTTSTAGALLLRYGARAHLGRIRLVLSEERLTALETNGAGTTWLFAGILLLVPGFITDLVALAILIGPIRRSIAALILRGLRARTAPNDGVVDLEPEEWRQVPPQKLSDRRDGPPS